MRLKLFLRDFIPLVMQCIDALLLRTVQSITRELDVDNGARWETKTVGDLLKVLNCTLSATGSRKRTSTGSNVGFLLKIASILRSNMSAEKVLTRLHVGSNG